MSMHEVVVRMGIDKRVPLKRLHKFQCCLRAVYLVQPVPYMWNVVIAQVCHEQQILPTTTSQRLDAHTRDVRDVELFVTVFWRRNMDNKAK
jgi:hypothetical protein